MGDDGFQVHDGIDVLYDDEAFTASFSVPVDGFRELAVVVSFPDGGAAVRIDRYSVVSSLNWQEHTEGGINVIVEFGD